MNPWESAGKQLARQYQNNRTAAPPPLPSTASGTSWAPKDETSFAVFARRLGRGLLWSVVVLAAITGLRSWFLPAAPATKEPTPATPAAPAYPTAEAQAVAARFTRAYLGWDQDHPEERAALLAAVLPAGADTTMGWDGKGHQDVEAVQPDTVTTGTQHQARVRVDALIRPAATAKDKNPAAHWVGLDVPVIVTAGRVIVTAEPGLVGIPTSGPKAPQMTTPPTDGPFSTSTQATVEQFFRALAAGTTDSVTAPGASVPALPDGVTLASLTSWTADTGSGEDRTGTASVSWTISGATIEQTYRVELTRVSSADATRWQVADVRGGTL